MSLADYYQRLPSPYEPVRIVVRKENARAFFTPRLAWRNPRMRTKAVRALLMLYHGGRCNYCKREVDNYWDTYRWHFDHLHDLQDYDVSPTTGIRQFRISGNDCANRSLELVFRHGREDVQLLCKDCHYHKNMRTHAERQTYAGAVVRTRDILGL
jgi:5-methylcytosine-specific restriction endonuclease McrA